MPQFEVYVYNISLPQLLTGHYQLDQLSEILFPRWSGYGSFAHRLKCWLDEIIIVH